MLRTVRNGSIVFTKTAGEPAADSEQDLVLCGPGADAASVDRVDRICEAVYPG